MVSRIAVLLVLILAGCEVAGQLTIFNDGKHELSIGEVPNTPTYDLYPDSSGPGFMFQFKRRF